MDEIRAKKENVLRLHSECINTGFNWCALIIEQVHPEAFEEEKKEPEESELTKIVSQAMYSDKFINLDVRRKSVVNERCQQIKALAIKKVDECHKYKIPISLIRESIITIDKEEGKQKLEKM